MNPQSLNCWSNLPLDVTKLVFDRLGFADFLRAKSVCSSWRSGSRQYQPNNPIPWMISFPRDQNHCLLFNPEQKEKLYKSRDFGDDFAKSVCVMTQGNWLLMLDPTYGDHCKSKCKENICEYNLYILHIFTGERINLPSLEGELWFIPSILVFWIDEKTKDYVIIQMFNEETTVSLKKRDNSWKTIPHLSLSGIEWSSNLLYKDHKLYCLIDYKLKVFDFSGDIPLLVFEISVYGCIKRAFDHPRISSSLPLKVQLPYSKNNVVVTLSGDILIVNSFRMAYSETWDFRINKLKGNNMWEEIDSLGDDEAILLDLGITVLTKDINGVLGNSIYFSDNDIFVFNLNTNKVEKPLQFVSSSIPFYSRWFLPSFKP